MLTRIAIFIGLLLSLFVLHGCGESEPCGGKGLTVDARPLPAPWKTHIPTLPEGAVACYDSKLPSSDTGPQYERSVRMPDLGPAEAQKALVTHLVANGWTESPHKSGNLVGKDRTLRWNGYLKTKMGIRAGFWCSDSVDFGWCHIKLRDDLAGAR